MIGAIVGIGVYLVLTVMVLKIVRGVRSMSSNWKV